VENTIASYRVFLASGNSLQSKPRFAASDFEGCIIAGSLDLIISRQVEISKAYPTTLISGVEQKLRIQQLTDSSSRVHVSGIILDAKPIFLSAHNYEVAVYPSSSGHSNIYSIFGDIYQFVVMGPPTSVLVIPNVQILSLKPSSFRVGNGLITVLGRNIDAIRNPFCSLSKRTVSCIPAHHSDSCYCEFSFANPGSFTFEVEGFDGV
jgi:hypothetical protein